MDILLLERISKLGNLGDCVTVKDGYARNFLLPQKKALRATAANKEAFAARRAQIDTDNANQRQAAEQARKTLDGVEVIVIRQAGESGMLYGSVTGRDIAAALENKGHTANRRQVVIPAPIKTLGLHACHVALHPEVLAAITVNVAMSPDEAEAQSRAAQKENAPEPEQA